MRRVNLKHKFFIVTAVAVSLMVFAMPLLAQIEDMMAARMAGEQAARANVNGSSWFAIGCLGGLIGVIIAYVVEPYPPAMLLLGKSPGYVAVFTDTYRATAKSIQTSRALTGCVVGYLFWGALYALALAASESSY